MNTNSLSYSNIATAEKIEIHATGWITRLINKISTIVARSELEASQARYALKRERQASHHQTTNLNQTEKHQFGLYHMID